MAMIWTAGSRLRCYLAALATLTWSGCTTEPMEPADPCEGITCVTTFPFVASGTTVDSPDHSLAAYSCDGAVLDGAESVFRLTVPEAGFLAAQAVVPGGSGVEVRLLSARAETSCLDGQETRAGGLVEPGEYYVIVDSPAGQEGSFELRLGLTTPADLTAHGLEHGADDAVRVFAAAWLRGDTRRFEYSVVDFAAHSSVKRQWYLDLATEELLFNLHVAHGRGANAAFDNTGYSPGFSNTPETHMSSFGVMRSAEAYDGMYGRSFRIDGLEQDINNNVRDRAIVMHPWTGSRAEFVASHGETQPTWGCPAVDDRIAPTLVERFHDGVLMFFWYTDWSSQSTYVSSAGL